MVNAALAKIHIAKKELGLEQDSYRAILFRVTGKRSSGNMNEKERAGVLSEFKRLGWKPKNSSNSKYRKASPNQHIRKVWALGKELDRLGYWRSSWKLSLKSLVKKETGVDDPDWLTTKQASNVIEALKAIQSRISKG